MEPQNPYNKKQVGNASFPLIFVKYIKSIYETVKNIYKTLLVYSCLEGKRGSFGGEVDEMMKSSQLFLSNTRPDTFASRTAALQVGCPLAL